MITKDSSLKYNIKFIIINITLFLFIIIQLNLFKNTKEQEFNISKFKNIGEYYITLNDSNCDEFLKLLSPEFNTHNLILGDLNKNVQTYTEADIFDKVHNKYYLIVRRDAPYLTSNYLIICTFNNEGLVSDIKHKNLGIEGTNFLDILY